jgi:hypothetical protein
MALTKIGYTLIKDNFKDSVSGSSTAHSASFSSRVTTAESELENTIVSSSAQISTDISGSLGTNASTIRTLSSATVSGSRDTASISGSLGANASTIRTLSSATVSGSRDAVSISGSRDAASISGSLGANASLIRTLTALTISGSRDAVSISGSRDAASISGSRDAASISGSFGNQRVGTTDDVKFANITGSGNISASGDLSITGMLDIDGTSNFANNVTMQKDLTVTGRIDAEEIHTTFISSSIAQATGSNIFGDSTTDSHQFTGSVDVSGSLRVSDGNVVVSDTLTATNIGAFTAAGAIDFNNENMTNVDIDSGTITGITDLAVADGGTGVSSLTDGGVLLGSGTSGITAMAVLTDGQMIVGDGSTDPVAESGATLRTSIGVGTTDDVKFANITGSNVSASVSKFTTATIDNITGNTTSSGDFGADGDLYVGGRITGSSGATFVDSVGIGETAPIATLHVKEGDSGLSSLNGSGTNLFLEANGSNAAGMTLASGNTANGFIIFGDSDSNFRGAIQYDHGAPDKMHFTTSGSQRVSIDQHGKVGIGTTGPDGSLHVHTATAGSVTADSSADDLVVETGGSGGISILTPAANQGEVAFGDPNDSNVGRFAYNHPGDYFALVAGASEIMRISGSGNVILQDNPARLGVGADVDQRVGGSFDVIQVGHTSQWYAETANAADRNVYIGNNFYHNGTNHRAIYEDQVSGIQFRAGTIRFNTTSSVATTVNLEAGGGRERMRISADGNVFIKTEKPSPTNSQSLPGYLQFEGLGWDTNSGSDPIAIRLTMGGSYSGVTSGGVIPHLAFAIQNSGDAGSTSETLDEHMRIVGNGKVGIGTNSPDEKFHVYGGAGTTIVSEATTGNDARFMLKTSDTQYTIGANEGGRGSDTLSIDDDQANQERLRIKSDGEIDGNFNDTSDRAQKENIKDLTNTLEGVKALNPSTFNWIKEKAKGDKTKIGFIAQDVEKQFPELVDGKEGEKSISTIGLVSVLTKTVQELIKRIEELEK